MASWAEDRRRPPSTLGDEPERYLAAVETIRELLWRDPEWRVDECPVPECAHITVEMI